MNGYGDGFLTKAAQDLVKIMMAFGGLDLKEFHSRLIAKVGNSPRDTNSATVEAILAEMQKE